MDRKRLSLLVAVLAILGAGAVTAFGGRSPADEVSEQVAHSGGYARAAAVAGQPPLRHELPATGPTALGKNMGRTDWTQARRAGGDLVE